MINQYGGFMILGLPPYLFYFHFCIPSFIAKPLPSPSRQLQGTRADHGVVCCHLPLIWAPLFLTKETWQVSQPTWGVLREKGGKIPNRKMATEFTMTEGHFRSSQYQGPNFTSKLWMIYAGWWLSLPLWKMMEWKSVGMLFHSQLNGKNHPNVPVTTKQYAIGFSTVDALCDHFLDLEHWEALDDGRLDSVSTNFSWIRHILQGPINKKYWWSYVLEKQAVWIKG